MPRAPKPAPPPRKKRDAPRDWYEVVASYSGNIAKVCVVAFAVALGYIIYAVYGGYLNTDLDARRLGNIALMGRVLAIAGVAGTIAFVIATLHEVAYAVAAGLVGLGLIFGIPMLLISQLPSDQSPAALEIHGWTFRAGIAICAIAVLRVIFQVGYTLKTGPKARENALREEEERLGPKKVKRTRGVWSKCWNLPYCHDTIREVCPAYKEGKSCWRIKKGCNCDPMLVETMIQAGAARIGKGQDKVSAQKQATADEYLREAMGAPAKGKLPERTLDCKKCPIYGEHQRQKFALVNPIAIVLTIAALIVTYPLTKQLYFKTVEGLAAFAAQFTLGENIDPERWFNYLNTSAVEIFFFTIVSLFILSYILKVVEWTIFVKKL